MHAFPRGGRGLERLLSAVLCVLFLLRAEVSAQAEDYSRWAQSMRIGINTTESADGAGVASAVDSFPMLVRLPPVHPAFAHALPTGADIRFSDADGKPLAYEIERFDPALKKGEIWVKIPRVDGNSDKDSFTMHWGKADAASRSDGPAVFRIPNVQYATLHLGEKGAGNRYNSAWPEQPAVPGNYDGDESREGVIGRCDSLDGTAAGDFLSLGGGMADFQAGLTISAWHWAAEVRNYARLVDMGNGEGRDNILLARFQTTLGTAYHHYDGDEQNRFEASVGMEVGRWRHLVVTVRGSAVRIYVDGLERASGDLGRGENINNVIRERKYVGRSNWAADPYYKGKVDELGIASTLRSSAWIKLAYETQKEGSAVLAFGPTVNNAIRIASQPAGARVKEGASVSLVATVQSATNIQFQWLRGGAPVPNIGRGGAAPASGVATVPLVLPAASLADAGSYQCRIWDGRDTLTTIPAVVAVDEDLALWPRALKVRINTTASGANVASKVENFPLALRLDATRFDFASAAAEGQDLRVSDPDGSSLAFQIAHWDAFAKQAEIWVRVPEVAGNSQDDFVTLHWGRPGVPARSRADSVFRTEEGYKGVWHLNDPALQPGAAEATGRSAAGATFLTQAGHPGPLGTAYSFAGTESRVSLPPAATGGLRAFTVSLWAKETVTRSCAPLLLCPTLFGGESNGAGGGDFWIGSRRGQLVLQTGLGGRMEDDSASTTARLDDGKWHHVAVVHDGTELVLYEGGVRRAAIRTNGMGLDAPGFDLGNLRWNDGTRSHGFIGSLDALQLSGQARSADWVRLAYETQREADNRTLAYGSQAAVSPTGISVHPPAGAYPGPLEVTLAHADTSVRIYYSLDGTVPDPAAPGVLAYREPLVLARSGTVTAVAFRGGLVSEPARAEYEVLRALSASDTLRPGDQIGLPGNQSLRYPTGSGNIPVTVDPVPRGVPPAGFEAEGPLLRLSVPDGAAFPLLEVVRHAGLPPATLFRVEGDAVLRVDASGGAAGTLAIRAPGTWFWGADMQSPSLRLTEAPAVADGRLKVAFAADDNVRNLLCRAFWWDGAPDSTDWIECEAGAGIGLEFPLSAPGHAPLELRLQAGDGTLVSAWPDRDARVVTVARPVAAGPGPLAVPAGKWRLVALPVASAALSLRALVAANGGAGLQAGLWEARPADPAGGSYRMAGADDPLPGGSALWIRSDRAAPALALPAVSTLASDSLGSFPVKLTKGWNLVGSPSLRPLRWIISRSDGEAYLKSPVKVLHRYADTGYVEVDSLVPWEGCFVYNHGGDTILSLRSLAAPAAKRSPLTAGPAVDLRLRGGGASLRLGARPWASDGLAVEDEPLVPPGRGARALPGLLRDGRRMGADIVGLRDGHPARWILPGEGLPAGLLSVEALRLPAGWEAWALSRAGGVRHRLADGASLPAAPGDTLVFLAGDPAALAARGELRAYRESPARAEARLRAGPGGPALDLALPGSARVTVRAWRADGSRLAAAAAELGPGWHRLPVLAPASRGSGTGWAEVTVSGRGWSFRRVLPFARF